MTSKKSEKDMPSAVPSTATTTQDRLSALAREAAVNLTRHAISPVLLTGFAASPSSP